MSLLEIIESVAPEVKKNRHIHAMWIEGSYATGKYTDQSDIDVWLDVDDDKADHCINIVRRHLQKVGEIDWEDETGVYSKNPNLVKHIFHLKSFTDEQTIELDLQEHSRKFVFSKNHHTIKVLFDKDNTIQWESN